ncbi:MAG: hypothetical protein DPW18_09210 [Chloroflexi bacterium]|nr:hypothetical protein [Chloroflexota bacterium]MDL1941618.1 response regulator [Chloroflexi bacterium CFX2]
MPRKQKTSKRLDNLFKDIRPEEDVREPKSKPKVQKEAPPPQPDPKPASQPQVVSTPAASPAKRSTSRLVLPDIVAPAPGGTSGAVFATNFQIGTNDWAVLRLIDEREGRVFTADEQLLIKQVTDQLSLALENARLFQETQKRAQELAAVNQVVTSVSGLLELTPTLQTIAESLVGLFSASRVSVAMLDENRTSLIIQADAANTFEKSPFIGSSVVVSESPSIEEVLRARRPLFIRSAPESPLSGSARDLFKKRGTVNLLIAPLVAGDEVIGTVNLDFAEVERLISQDDLRLLETIVVQTGTAIQKNRLFERIEQSETNLRALFSAMEDVVLVITREGRYDQIAPTNPSLLVRPPQELLGKTFHDVLPKEVADHFLEKTLQALNSSEKVQFEYDLPINEHVFWFLASLTKLDEDRVFWVARDITERKKAEEIIQRRNEYLAASAEIGRLVTSTLDLNTIFARTVNLINERFGFYHAAIFVVEETGFNAVLKEATGAAGMEMKKREHSLPIDSTSIVGKVAAEGAPVIVNDTTKDALLHRPNPLLPETRAEAAIPLRIGSRIIGALDIQSKTAGVFTEDNISVLQTLADQIAVAIDNARSFELSQQAVMEMREVDRLKSQFLANMSHELRTPLNSIIGFSRVILKGIDGPVTELMQQDLTAIYNSGQHLLGLINDILDLAKIEAGKMELAFDEVNISDLANSVLSTMTGLIKDKPIQMKKVIEPNLPTVRADAIRVRQVMINLLSNAAKFTEEGEITVTVASQLGPGGQGEIVVSVTDTGPGISEADQEKLFLPFSQVDASPTRKTGGTGLGLSICQQLINMHGGRIWVESEIGKGSTFHFTLPLFRKESEVHVDGNKMILSIDDDAQVIGLYERYLQPQGYHVIPLTDPARAVERVKQVKPFAVTLDIMMPGIDGWTVLEKLKSDPETRNIPVIVCSIVEEYEKGFNLGATDYLVKPILEEDLVNSLDRLNADGSIREVLVIDDNRDDLRLLGKMLNDDGRYKAVLAEGGRSGWNLISTGNPPHAIILDLFMPDVNGFQILERLQADRRLRDIPVIVISGMDVSSEQKKQLEEFGQRLLTKGSFNEKELLTSIQRALDRIQAKKNSGV